MFFVYLFVYVFVYDLCSPSYRFLFVDFDYERRLANDTLSESNLVRIQSIRYSIDKILSDSKMSNFDEFVCDDNYLKSSVNKI